MEERVQLLDATLRDGSYCVDFQFTAADTAILVGMLDSAGVGFIELGHGSGTFNHKAPPQFQSATRQAMKDEEYLAAARKSATRAKLGIITGPFGTDDMHVVAEHGLDFVRLACMANKALDPANLQMCERAKSLGLLFSVNLMQTVAITPTQLVEIALAYAKSGCDWFYVVDSAGGLLPASVTEYVRRVREATNITVGFHAHHNSGLAIANCLAAIEAGATMVDGTLQGLGRDVGNAPTEQLLLMLQRIGYEREINIEQVCHAGDLVRGLLLDKGNDPTYYASGSSEVHSSNVEALVAFAHSRGLGARSLLAAIGHGDVKLIGSAMKTFPEEILGPACARSSKMSELEPRQEVIEILGEDIARASSTSLPVLADVLFARAAKWHRSSVLHLVPAAQFPFHGPLPWELDRWCGITVGIDQLGSLDFGDRQPDQLVIDAALGSVANAIPDRFSDILIDAAITLAGLCPGAWLACSDPAVAAQLTARGARNVAGPDQPVGATNTVILVGYKDPPAMPGKRLLRPGIATAIAARIATVLDLRERLAEGSVLELVDPIFVAGTGQVVVDDPSCPSTVIDGAGRATDVTSAATMRARTLMRGRGRL